MTQPSDDFSIKDGLTAGPQRGRGAGLNPGNRFESTRLHVLGDQLDADRLARETDPDAVGQKRVPTTVIADLSRSLINAVDSPDQPFSFTINPYRGCEHGCIYCYARPDHERLGMSMGLDFETKIFAKLDAPAILKRELANPRWAGPPIMIAGVTDCYQPVEARLKLTRACLEVMHDCGQPASIVTKNRLITRDLDLLAKMAARRTVAVMVSVTTLDNHLASVMEPRASAPAARLAAIRELADAGVPVGVMTAPILPGLNDKEIPAILQAAYDAGARHAGYVLLRLPYQIKDLFLDWLRTHFPQRASHVESLIRDTRDGGLYQNGFHVRKKGTGAVAEQIGTLFAVFTKKIGYSRSWQRPTSEHFRHPIIDGQMRLFDGV
jgi:DNA repair photolyase